MTDICDNFDDVLQSALSRRKVLVGGFATAAATFFAPQLSSAASAQKGVGSSAIAGQTSGVVGGVTDFESIGISTIDDVVVPYGYVAEPLFRWGDPISGSGGRFVGADITIAEQLASAGQSHDGMHYFPLVSRGPNQRGLLVLNHEITETEFLFEDDIANWTPEKSALAMAAQGCSVIEIKRTGNKWKVMPSGYARRITTMTPMELTGPAAGHPLLQTNADPTGRTVLGTANNCANGKTPWGTYLTCEENFNAYFGTTTAAGPNALQTRYGVGVGGFGPPLYLTETRFDIVSEPNESNRFGWVVEIDPFDPTSTPKKRTALGRIKHENAELVECADGRVVVYMGDDERGERIYKFVSDKRWQDDPDSVLDSGTLYVAVFNDDLTPGDAKGLGSWVPLTPETTGFATMAEILIDTRGAANAVGGTRMDRPEWVAADPKNPGTVYCTLTNNSRRGTTSLPLDEANPRSKNPFGHIIRWDEKGGDPAATSFTWDIFIFAGDPETLPSEGNPAPVTAGIPAFGAPDGLWFDGGGSLWIQTDGTQPVPCNNQMLCADTTTGEVKRFLVGPVGCEVTGITQTPDGTAAFVNIQHPGEDGDDGGSDWPDKIGGLPRSSTIVIRRLDGGPVVGPYA